MFLIVHCGGIQLDLEAASQLTWRLEMMLDPAPSRDADSKGLLKKPRRRQQSRFLVVHSGAAVS